MSNQGVQMNRSYFVPMILLGSVIFGAGLYGIRAAKIALEHYEEQSRHYVRKPGIKVDRETMLSTIRSSRGEATALRCEQMRLHALSATFVGLVFIVWAFDRRSMYVRLQAARRGEAMGSLLKVKMQIRSIAFSGLLLLFAAGAVMQLRQIMPEWVNHMRARSQRMENERMKAFLEENGIPVKYVYWGHGKGGKTIHLEGPEVSEVSILSELPINYLTLQNTQVTNLNPLRKCPLWNLSLEGSSVSDISLLAGTQIQHLDLRETNVLDLRPLVRMPNLKSVYLSRQQIIDNLEVLRNLSITVKEVPGGPSFSTGGIEWQKEYETVDVNNMK
jgi:hypothetical protein